ncbi:sensor domain-containing diguanylate cyclase [Oceanicoccus sagamiensis]|uniref:diguanylate cyclase n=1 Tax=Oceanicoccus sagamiensis TaxID=716816 RepID=A0A1X9ND62_9GAMM|nr:sensor domain-containing diguanylate cyclase [Oceanicoccus sagamiensis]ARN75988.1 hypothetical protein BST96_18950 [Oceanicoccus sagamiensis]
MAKTYSPWIIDNESLTVPVEKWQHLVSLITRVFDAPGAYIVESNEHGFRSVTGCFDGEVDTDDSVTPVDVNIYCSKILNSGDMLYVPDASKTSEWKDNPEYTEEGLLSYLGWPIRWPDGKIFGSICVFDGKATHYQEHVIELLSTLAELVEADLLLITQHEEMRQLSHTDDLTGLYNRRGFELLVDRQMQLNRRYDFTMGLFYLDIDNMKAINDTHGHKAGDRALQLVANACKESLRDSDIACRLGGDEFVMACALTHLVDIDPLVERVTGQVKDLAIDIEGELVAVEVSLGFVTNQNDKSLSELLDEADRQMYRAKEARKGLG